jgi:hypothetical protein
MTNTLAGAPVYSRKPSHPYELTITFEVESLDQLVQPFRFAFWVEGHNQETDFLNYHFNSAKNQTTFLDFLERVLLELGRYKDSSYQVIKTVDFDTCSDKDKYNKNFSRDQLSIKCSLIRSFIDRKRQIENVLHLTNSDTLNVSELLSKIFDACHQKLFNDKYSSEQMKKILLNPLKNLKTKVSHRFGLNAGKRDVLFTLFALANSAEYRLGRETLRDFVFSNFYPVEKEKFSAAYFDKFLTRESQKRSDQLAKMRTELMDLASADHKAEVTDYYDRLLSISDFGPK